jgi:D-alanyl-D-alanine carboxypeptidase/D-alanyl-D-alanine-endopeptidase (penicillin-binding protein 4)
MKYFMPILLVLLVFAYPQQIGLANDQAGIFHEAAKLIDNGGYAVERDGKLLLSHNLHTMYIPASIVKIATVLAALQVLGSDFRFQTHFFLDPSQNLYIKGFGDPFLISEEVALVMDRLQQLGLHTINDIYLDNSSFQLSVNADGLGISDNPYDALNSALAVNFNTVKIQVSDSGVVNSAEEQTPTLPLMHRLGKNMKPGTHRVSISKVEKNGQAVISQYVGELFRAFQKEKGFSGSGKIAEKLVPSNMKPFYVHRSSRALEEIIEPLMLYSNNFIANQLFLVCGAKRYGYPATWDKGGKALVGYLQDELGLSNREVKIVEGSGLSRKNRISPHSMVVLLKAFKPNALLLPIEDGIRIKSGTLKGVYSYAGYFVNSGEFDSFVLILNQSGNKRDELLEELEGYYKRKD